MPVVAGDPLERDRARLERGVHGVGSDLLGDLGDELVDRLVRVGELRGDRDVDLAAGGVAPHPGRQAALLARLERLVDHPVDVGADLELLRAQAVLLAVVGDRDLLVQRLDQLGVHGFLRLVGGHPADVDAADRHALGDLVRLGRVPGVRAHGRHEHDGDDDYEGYLELASQGG